MKIIFINWRWNIQQPQEILVESDLVIASSFERNNADKFNSFINEKLSTYPKASVLVFIHADDDNAVCFNEDKIRINNCDQYKVIEFFGKEPKKNPKVYELFDQYSTDRHVITPAKFGPVWNYFWGKDLHDLLYGLISTFLPLAIDQQGLSRTNESNRSEYIQEICDDLGKALETIHNVLENKKQIINTQEENLLEDYRLTQEQIASIAFPLECNGNSEVTLERLKKYITNNDDHNTIAKWLNKVVVIINEKIYPSK